MLQSQIGHRNPTNRAVLEKVPGGRALVAGPVLASHLYSVATSACRYFLLRQLVQYRRRRAQTCSTVPCVSPPAPVSSTLPASPSWSARALCRVSPLLRDGRSLPARRRTFPLSPPRSSPDRDASCGRAPPAYRPSTASGPLPPSRPCRGQPHVGALPYNLTLEL